MSTLERLKNIENYPNVTFVPEKLDRLYANDIHRIASLLGRRGLINGFITLEVVSGQLKVSILNEEMENATPENPVYYELQNEMRSIIGSLNHTLDTGGDYWGSGSGGKENTEIQYYVYLGYDSVNNVARLGISLDSSIEIYSDASATITDNNYMSVSGSLEPNDPLRIIGRITAILSGSPSYEWSIPTITPKTLYQGPISPAGRAEIEHNETLNIQGGTSTERYHTTGIINTRLHNASAFTLLGRPSSGTGAVTGISLKSNNVLSFQSNQLRINDKLGHMAFYRLSLISGNPYPNTETSSADGVYCTPYQGGVLALIANTGSGVEYIDMTEKYLALTQFNYGLGSVANTNYDIFAVHFGTTYVLYALPWTNDTTPSITRLFTSGMWNFGSAYAYGRYLGTVRTNSSNKLQFTQRLPHVYNVTNKLPTKLKVIDSTDAWSYDSAAYRYANGNANNRIDIVAGMADVIIDIQSTSQAVVGGNVSARAFSGIGVDSQTVNSADIKGWYINQNAGLNMAQGIISEYQGYVPIGLHYYAWIERGDGIAGTNGWRGDNGDGGIMQSGMSGIVYI